VMEILPQVKILLPLAVAAGVDLYLTLLTIALAVLMGWGNLGETALSPLEGMPILIGLALLYGAEAATESRPTPALLWHNLQLILRPLGAGLLGLFLLRAEPAGWMVLGAATTGIVAAFSHVLVWGQGIILRIVPLQRPSPRAFGLWGDLAVVALLALTLANPDLGGLLAALLLLIGLFFGRRRHGAVRFGFTLFVEKVWGIVSPTSWRTGSELPAWVRKGIDMDWLEATRGAPAATWGVVGPHRFEDGWILQKNREIFFAYRRGTAPLHIRLDGVEETVELGPLSKTIAYRSPEGDPSALFLQMGLIGPESHK
jgi:hypothetical protein